MARKTIQPITWWPTGITTIEAERISPRGASHAIDAIYADGRLIGHAFGRPERIGGPRWWDYSLGETAPSGFDFSKATYPTTERRLAIEALAEKAAR